MTDLKTRYLGLELRSPLLPSSSALTGTLDSLRKLEAAGAGAVVLPSLFEEQLTHDALEVDRLLETGAYSHGEALSYFPDLDDYNTGADDYLALVRAAKAELTIPVIASLNGISSGGWVRHAALIQDAGADALELNIYYVAAQPGQAAAEAERRYLDVVIAVRDAIDIPLAVKIGPYFSALAHMATEIVAAGADGLVLFNRFYEPDLDLETLDVVPRLVPSRSDDLFLPLRWTAILRGRIEASLACATGIHTAADVAKALLAGADVAMMASALIGDGPQRLADVLRELRDWLTEKEYESVEQLKGSVSQRAVADPDVFERSNYLKALASYSSPFLR